MKPERQPQLRRELNRRLTFPVVSIVALAGLLGFYGAQLHADRVFDGWLLDAAQSLAHQVRVVDGEAQVSLSPQAEALLTFDVADRTFFEVVQAGQHVLGQSGIPKPPDDARPCGAAGRSYDARFVGHGIRVACVDIETAGAQTTTVRVAETLNKRHEARKDLLLTLSPAVVLVLMAALVIDLALRRTLASLQLIASRWNQQSHGSLAAIPADGVPNELLPFASALNDLLLRVRTMLERERQFAATVAHQLRTPLTGLRLGLTRAAAASDPAAGRAILDELGVTAQRTARLVQQLLALSRVDPNVRDSASMKPLDLVALAHETGESYLDAAQAGGIELEFESSAASVPVRGEPDLLSEALGNLIDNAIRYTPPSGHILISVQATPPAISVADSGPGIPSDEREVIFERFVRGRSARGDGSGLGLAIVKEIAVLHGAALSVSSSERGGACFTLTFS
jgi:two-component system sensor histidine kinase TctE